MVEIFPAELDCEGPCAQHLSVQWLHNTSQVQGANKNETHSQGVEWLLGCSDVQVPRILAASSGRKLLRNFEMAGRAGQLTGLATLGQEFASLKGLFTRVVEYAREFVSSDEAALFTVTGSGLHLAARQADEGHVRVMDRLGIYRRCIDCRLQTLPHAISSVALECCHMRRTVVIHGESAFPAACLPGCHLLSAEVWTTVVTDVHASQQHQAAYFIMGAKQIRSVMAVPLLNNAGDVVAALQVSRCDASSTQTGEGDEFTPEDAHILESAATFTQMVRILFCWQHF